MKKIKTALVLEGGGLRGAYTAGALSWLLDNNIFFDNAYGISTGAVHLCNYLSESKERLYDFSVDGIVDKRIIGIRPFLRCGRIVDYDFLFDHIIKEEKQFDINDLRDCKTDAFIGLYELNEGKTRYYSVREISLNELKASTSLPIIGKVVKENGREILDGGITDMIPIEQAVADGCNRNLIITTKPLDYVRKPAKKAIVELMRISYPQCKRIAEDYKIRHLNYAKQIDLIRKLEENNEAVYCYPSRNSNVTRMGGSREELSELFDLGYQDMEDRKEQILKLLEKDC
ncbi:MAG: patatin family protein [Erysipelotrichaceae bacterium]|nr:patatin family protein [Erysipelotrichaceae bacterium]